MAGVGTLGARQLTLLLGLTALAFGVALFAPPMIQPRDYHAFADQRSAFGIPNFMDVVSNIGFALAGLWGLAIVLGERAPLEHRVERWPWLVFFFGVLLTAFGSAWFHWAPDNERLFWDRLPMTIAFMALFAAQIADRIGRRVGVGLLAPLLLLGMATVIYWRATERAGAGNVIPYATLQGYTVLVLLLMAAGFRSRYSHAHLLYWIFAWYLLAKALEHWDHEIFALTARVISGHTLKHLAAAMGGAVAAWMLLRRRPLAAPLRV